MRLVQFHNRSTTKHSLCYWAAILQILLRDENLDADVDINSLAQKTEGFSGSDLKRESSIVHLPSIT